MHELWLRTEERYEKRWRDVTNYLHYVTTVLNQMRKENINYFSYKMVSIDTIV